MNKREQTKQLYHSLCQLIPGGVNSPVRACLAMEQLPLIVASGKADMIIDVDQIPYIDLCSSWGALIHGHAHPDVVSAVQARMALGSSFGATTPLEEQLAKKIIELMPAIEKVRFVSSGTEATMSAIRLARGFTKRDLIVKFSGNYHGHADFLLVQAGSGVAGLPASSSAGVPTEIISKTICLPYNNLEVCQAFFQEEKWCDQIAGVIIEPVAGNMGVVPAKPEFLQMLRRETERIGAVLIFDEVISGFRVALGGAQQLYGIVPDLTCLGKIMGGGFPAAAFGGSREIMEHLAPLGQVYQAGTLSGNPIAMEAGLQSLKLLEVAGFYEELQRKTDLITKPVQEYLSRKKKAACIQQVGSMFTLFFGRTEVNDFEEALQLDRELYKRCFRYLFDKGVYVAPAQHEAWFISAAHTEEHLIYVRDILLEFCNSY